MPIDSEVAKERIWKEHCEKMILQSHRCAQEGRSHAEFTLNPYHLQHNKPVTDPVSIRSPDFLDRPKATLAALSARLANAGLSPSGSHDSFAESSPRNVARANKSRAVKGNNIFGAVGGSQEAKRQLFEEWSGVLNNELGGGKTFRESTGSFLPPINSKPLSPTQSLVPNSPAGKNSSNASPLSPNAPNVNSVPSPAGRSNNKTEAASRDGLIQEMLLRSAKPPTLKYERPLTESQVLGWDAHRALRPNPMFTFLHKTCDMTRFAAESGHSPTKKQPTA